MSAREIEIRRALPDDLKEIAKIRVAAIYGSPQGFYSEQQMRAWGAEKRFTVNSLEMQEFYVAAENRRSVGYASLNLIAKEISAIYVIPEFTGCGIGSSLLLKLESVARLNNVIELSLDASLNAVRFYKNREFIAIRKAKGTFNGVESEYLVMNKKL